MHNAELDRTALRLIAELDEVLQDQIEAVRAGLYDPRDYVSDRCLWMIGILANLKKGIERNSAEFTVADLLALNEVRFSQLIAEIQAAATNPERGFTDHPHLHDWLKRVSPIIAELQRVTTVIGGEWKEGPTGQAE